MIDINIILSNSELATELYELGVIDFSTISMVMEALEKARREEMEACCRDVCPYCKEGLTAEWEGCWEHTYPSEDGEREISGLMCQASPIRQRWQQQGQGQEERSAGE